MKKIYMTLLFTFMSFIVLFGYKINVNAAEKFDFDWVPSNYYRHSPNHFNEWSDLYVSCKPSDYNYNAIVAVITVLGNYEEGNIYATPEFNDVFNRHKLEFNHNEYGGEVGDSSSIVKQHVIYEDHLLYPDEPYNDFSNISVDDIYHNYINFGTIMVSLEKVNDYSALVKVPAGFVYCISYGAQELYDNPDDYSLISEDGMRYRGTVFGAYTYNYFYAKPGELYSLLFGFGNKYNDLDIYQMQNKTYVERKEEIIEEQKNVENKPDETEEIIEETKENVTLETTVEEVKNNESLTRIITLVTIIFLTIVCFTGYYFWKKKKDRC